MARILVFGNANRKDYVEQFEFPAQEHEIIWIHFTDKKPSQKELFGIRILWIIKFWNIQQIFNKYSPDSVVLFHVENTIEALVLIEAKFRNIKVFQIDHGISHPVGYGKKPQKRKSYNNLLKKIHYKLLEWNSKAQLNDLNRTRYKQFKQARELGNGKEVYKHLAKTELVEYFLPDCFLCYSQHNLESFKYNYLKDVNCKLNHIFIGIPNFDKFFSNKKRTKNKTILIIDQPIYLRMGVEKHRYIYVKVAQFFKSKGYNVAIKYHPMTKKEIRDNILKEDIIVLSKDQYEQEKDTFEIIFGFFSTLLIPYILDKKSFVITYNTDQYFSTGFYTNEQVVYSMNDINELGEVFSKKNELLAKQNLKAIEFINHYIYKYDGLSGHRLSNLFPSKKNLYETQN